MKLVLLKLYCLVLKGIRGVALLKTILGSASSSLVLFFLLLSALFWFCCRNSGCVHRQGIESRRQSSGEIRKEERY